MERMGVRLFAGGLVALCWAVCVTGALAAEGAKTIAQAPSVKFNAPLRGQLYDGAFYSGYSVAFWTASFAKGDHIAMQTKSSGGDTPPCQILYMPGTDDLNVGATSPKLEPASQSRHGTRDTQSWVATDSGTHVLAMTNADIALSGEQECLEAPAGRPFTFKVTVAHRGSGAGAGKQEAGGGGGSAATHVVAPGQSLWVIAQGIVGKPPSVAEIAAEVDRLWRLNAARIGTGDRNLIFPGQRLRLR